MLFTMPYIVSIAEIILGHVCYIMEMMHAFIEATNFKNSPEIFCESRPGFYGDRLTFWLFRSLR